MAKDLENSMIDNNMYIMTNLNHDTSMNMVIKLTQWIEALPIVKQTQKPKKIDNDTVYQIGSGNSVKIISPYEKWPLNKPVLNVYINCGGGTCTITDTILTLFNIASAKGAIIKTYNLNSASSSGSRIAVSGTKGYRYMAENAYNFIHFGDITVTVNRENELEFISQRPQRHTDLSYQTYLDHTKLTKEEIKQYQSAEGSGMLSAAQCLEKGLCDWIITNDGRWIKNIKDIKTR